MAYYTVKMKYNEELMTDIDGVIDFLAAAFEVSHDMAEKFFETLQKNGRVTMVLSDSSIEKFPKVLPACITISTTNI